MSEEKRKKSWKEIDQQRDRSTHVQRKDERAVKLPEGRSSRRYRAALENAFRIGSMGKVVEKLSQNPDAPTASDASAEKTDSAQRPARQKLIHSVTSAATTADTVEALNRLLEWYELPEDFDLLTRALEHPDDKVKLRSMEIMERMLATTKPRRSGVLKARLMLIQDDTNTGEELLSMAERVLCLL